MELKLNNNWEMKQSNKMIIYDKIENIISFLPFFW